MKKFHHPPKNMDVADAIVKTLEMETGQTVFTIRIFDDAKDDKFFTALVVFENKNILEAKISIVPAGSKWGCRIQGKYLD